jgi:hypothetical protein
MCFIQLLTDSMAQELPWDAIKQIVKNLHKLLELETLPRNSASGRLSHLTSCIQLLSIPQASVSFSLPYAPISRRIRFQVRLLHMRVTSVSKFGLKAGYTD